MYLFGWILQGVLALWLAIILHECGHLVAGLINGWRFQFLAAGPLYFAACDEGGWRFSINKNTLIWRGMTHLQDVDEQVHVNKWLFYMAAGPVFSIGSGLLLLFLALVGHYGLRFAGIYAFISIFMGFIAALPLPTAATGIPSDGERIFRLLSKGFEQEVEIAAIQVSKEKEGLVQLSSEEHIAYHETLTKSDDIIYQMMGYMALVRYYRAHGPLSLAHHHRQKLQEVLDTHMAPEASDFIAEFLEKDF